MYLPVLSVFAFPTPFKLCTMAFCSVTLVLNLNLPGFLCYILV